MKTIVVFFVLCSLSLSCINNSLDEKQQSSTSAKYVLPYPIGKSYTCSQGFNMPYSHEGTFSYSVDFTMPIGTLVTAARSGRVVYILQSYSDSDQTEGHENVVIIVHEDTTYSRYAHLTFKGARVKINQMVMPGDSLGLSGSSGTNGGPHLHFDVTKTFSGKDDQTIPFDFKNIVSHPFGFQKGVAYKALPY